MTKDPKDIVERLRKQADVYRHVLRSPATAELFEEAATALSRSREREAELEEALGSSSAAEHAAPDGATAAQHSAGQCETGWLVEQTAGWHGHGPPKWWSVSAGWTNDASAALRFSRCADALSFIDGHGFGSSAFPSEHRWG